MSDYIVYKKVECSHPKIRPGFARYDAECAVCWDKGFVYEEMDLEDALLELVKTSAKARMILQSPTKFK